MDAADRRAAVLRAVVETYVATAQPVASQTVAQVAELGVSSATVRNDMHQLEREGYIVQPHTSAGRIPTERGYRYFVDHFTTPSTLPAGPRRVVSQFFASVEGALDDLLTQTSQLLARLTSHTAVVVGPSPDRASVRSVHLVRLHEELLLVVLVLANGVVEKEALAIPSGLGDDPIARAERALGGALAGRRVGEVEAPSTGDPEVDALVARVHATLVDQHRAAREPVYVGGTSHLAEESDAFGAERTVARLLEVLEHQAVVVALVRELIEGGVTVRIGSENEVEALRGCSLVLAPYGVEGPAAGTLGVLGPTRMDYRRAVAAVAAVSERLGAVLSA
jgi:heat-inducible transcriptional repressor